LTFVLSNSNLCITGLFLYLGVSSIGTTEMFDRCKLFISDTKDIPKLKWNLLSTGFGVSKLFTAIQVVLLGMMWWMKENDILESSVLIGLLAPIRIALEMWKIISMKDLEVLDGEIE
jgi:hypothetical protein